MQADHPTGQQQGALPCASDSAPHNGINPSLESWQDSPYASTAPGSFQPSIHSQPFHPSICMASMSCTPYAEALSGLEAHTTPATSCHPPSRLSPDCRHWNSLPESVYGTSKERGGHDLPAGMSSFNERDWREAWVEQGTANGSRIVHPRPQQCPPRNQQQRSHDWNSLQDNRTNNVRPRIRTLSNVTDEEAVATTGREGTGTPSEKEVSPASTSVVVPRGSKKKGGGKREPDRTSGRHDTPPLTFDLEPRLNDDITEVKEKVDHRKKRRNRTIRSCVPCHSHKRKADRKRPCARCITLSLTGTCVYDVDRTWDMHDPTVSETERLRRRIAELEQVVRELRRHPQVPSVPISSSSSNHASSIASFVIDEKGQNGKRGVIADRFAAFKLDESTMQAEARITDNAALFMPTHPRRSSNDGETGKTKNGADKRRKTEDYKAEPYMPYLLPGEEVVFDKIGRKTFLAAPAERSMLRRLRELTATVNPDGQGLGNRGTLSVPEVPEDLAFTGVFPNIRKTYPFTTIWSHENFIEEIVALLPTKDRSEVLLSMFQEEIGPFFLAWHTPTLVADHRTFFSVPAVKKANVPLSSFGAPYDLLAGLPHAGVSMRNLWSSQLRFDQQRLVGSTGLECHERIISFWGGNYRRDLAKKLSQFLLTF